MKLILQSFRISNLFTYHPQANNHAVKQVSTAWHQKHVDKFDARHSDAVNQTNSALYTMRYDPVYKTWNTKSNAMWWWAPKTEYTPLTLHRQNSMCHLALLPHTTQIHPKTNTKHGRMRRATVKHILHRTSTILYTEIVRSMYLVYTNALYPIHIPKYMCTHTSFVYITTIQRRANGASCRVCYNLYVFVLCGVWCSWCLFFFFFLYSLLCPRYLPGILYTQHTTGDQGMVWHKWHRVEYPSIHNLSIVTSSEWNTTIIIFIGLAILIIKIKIPIFNIEI